MVGEDFNPLVTPPPDPPPATAYSEQEYEQYAPGSIVEPFVETGRWSIEQAVGGQPAWDAGVNFAKVLARSPYRTEVETLYQEAHLDLSADLSKLTARADITAQRPALEKLISTSVPTGKLQVPELDLKTIADELVPVQQENFYRQTVDAAGDGRLLRQAYVEAEGHCNFTPPEYIAGLHAVEYRLRTGGWGNVTTAKSLQASALALHEGSAAFIPFEPGPLTAASNPFDAEVQGKDGILGL